MVKHGMRAPELQVDTWFNTPEPLTLSALKGKVVVLHAFQMLCPGCVIHGLPQAASVAELYSTSDVQVIGLHSVFEHHNVMTAAALDAFIHEYRLRFPIAVDRPSPENPMPLTMRNYNLQGTPALVLIDKTGRIRFQHFGRLLDLQLGDLIGRLSMEAKGKSGSITVVSPAEQGSSASASDDDGCNPWIPASVARQS